MRMLSTCIDAGFKAPAQFHEISIFGFRKNDLASAVATILYRPPVECIQGDFIEGTSRTRCEIRLWRVRYYRANSFGSAQIPRTAHTDYHARRLWTAARSTLPS